MLDERWGEEAEEIGLALRKMLAVESSIERVRAAEVSADGRDPALEAALDSFGLGAAPENPELLARIAYELGRALAATVWVEATPAALVLGRAGVAYGFEGDTPAALKHVALVDGEGVRIEVTRGSPRRTAAGDFLVRHEASGEGERAGDGVAADKMRRIMRLLDAARLVGASEALLEYGVAYAKEREQFGKPIAAFQAVAHRLVDSRIVLDAADLLLRKAAFCGNSNAGGDGAPPTVFAIMARAKAVECARDIAAAVHQVFGGNGFTLDYHCQLYSRRIRSWAMRLNRSGPELAELARVMLDPARRNEVRNLWHFDRGAPLPRWARERDGAG